MSSAQSDNKTGTINQSNDSSNNNNIKKLERSERAVLLVPGQTRAIECQIFTKDLGFVSDNHTKNLLVSVTAEFGKDIKLSESIHSAMFAVGVTHTNNEYSVIWAEFNDGTIGSLKKNELAIAHFNIGIYGPVLIMDVDSVGENVSLTVEKWNSRELTATNSVGV
jgi:hypothetical protein